MTQKARNLFTEWKTFNAPQNHLLEHCINYTDAHPEVILLPKQTCSLLPKLSNNHSIRATPPSLWISKEQSRHRCDTIFQWLPTNSHYAVKSTDMALHTHIIREKKNPICGVKVRVQSRRSSLSLNLLATPKKYEALKIEPICVRPNGTASQHPAGGQAQFLRGCLPPLIPTYPKRWDNFHGDGKPNLPCIMEKGVA